MNEELDQPEITDPAPPPKELFDPVIRYKGGSWQDEEGGFHDGRGGYYPPDLGQEGETAEEFDSWVQSNPNNPDSPNHPKNQ